MVQSLSEDEGVKISTGTILDATIIEVPKQRNTKEENTQVKKGEIPSEWEKDPSKLSQKDTEARWTKKGIKVTMDTRITSP